MVFSQSGLFGPALFNQLLVAELLVDGAERGVACELLVECLRAGGAGELLAAGGGRVWQNWSDKHRSAKGVHFGASCALLHHLARLPPRQLSAPSRGG